MVDMVDINIVDINGKDVIISLTQTCLFVSSHTWFIFSKSN